VLSAQNKESTRGVEALETLCRAYWYPLYAYIRRQGHSPHDAQDLTQAFFADILETGCLVAADRERGRFRTFLLAVLKRFLLQEWRRLRAQKRGGGQTLLSLDTATAESRYQTEPGPDLPPDRIYERRWALTLLDQALARLRTEFAAAGKIREFDQLKVFLTAEKGEIAYADVAANLGMNEGSARVAVHRLRRRFRDLFREEIAHTVSRPEEVEEEARYLLGVLG